MTTIRVGKDFFLYDSSEKRGSICVDIRGRCDSYIRIGNPGCHIIHLKLGSGYPKMKVIGVDEI